MSRRVRLPGADELFRATSPAGEPDGLAPAARAVPPLAAVPDPVPPAEPVQSAPEQARDEAETAVSRPATRAARGRGTRDRRTTGRERHDEKITVYVSADELIDLEQARLTLRREHGVAIDRGRIVREALAVVLADLEAKGESSILVRRLGDG